MNRIAAVVAGLSLAFVGTSATIADTINVPGDQPTIAAAISASVNGDVINIAAGTYNEANLNPGGKAITIQGTINEAGTLATTIDAQQGGSVFVINSGEGSETVIQNLIITGGMGTDLGEAGSGIVCEAYSSPTIRSCTISSNAAYVGGGIFCKAYSSPTISGCTISGNTALDGGGICSSGGNPTIIDCTISGNTAYGDGGGTYCSGGNPSISDCTISGNTANSDGGGIYCWKNSNLTISGCTIDGNTALNGGGIFSRLNSPTISDCTISGNTANGGGGGIYCFQISNPTISNCTILDNTAEEEGGGIYCTSSSNPSVENVIILGNSTPQVRLDNGSTLTQGNTQQELIAQLQSTIDAQQSAIEDLQQIVTACCAAQSCAGDENNDGVVNIDDLLIVISVWGPCP